MFSFFASKWVHVLVVAVAAAAPAALAAGGVDSSALNAVFTLIASAVGGHAGSQYAKGK